MKYIKYIALAAFFACGVCSCSEDSLDDQSVFSTEAPQRNEFDIWLLNNYVYPYNIDFKYRMEDKESDHDYNLTPADYDKSVAMAKLVKFLWIDAYTEVMGDRTFICTLGPKMIHLVGSPAYKNNGDMILGTAEGGLKITLYNVNNINVLNVADLNYYYFKTIHHEFAHILHQTRPYPTAFKEISGSEYVKATWAARLKTAGTTGAPIINSKFEIVYNYMLDTWNIDLDVLRDTVLDHQERIGELDLNEL